MSKKILNIANIDNIVVIENGINKNKALIYEYQYSVFEDEYSTAFKILVYDNKVFFQLNTEHPQYLKGGTYIKIMSLLYDWCKSRHAELTKNNKEI